MNAYKVRTLNIDKLLYQNQGEILDIIEGCLIDNFLIATKRGYILLIERYVNCWTSEHVLYFSKDEKEINNIWYKLDRGDDK